MQLSKSATQGSFGSVRENYKAQYRAVRILKSSQHSGIEPLKHAWNIRLQDSGRKVVTTLAERSFENRRNELSGWHSAREVGFRNRKLDILAERGES